MEQAVIIEQNTKPPAPATIVTEEGVFLYIPNGPGYGVLVPLEGSQAPSRGQDQGGQGHSQDRSLPGGDRWRPGSWFDDDSLPAEE